MSLLVATSPKTAACRRRVSHYCHADAPHATLDVNYRTRYSPLPKPTSHLHRYPHATCSARATAYDLASISSDIPSAAPAAQTMAKP